MRRLNPSLPLNLTVSFLFVVVVAALLYKSPEPRSLQADEVRVYRLKDYDTPASQILVRLQGAAAQKAADNFVVEKSGACNLCLNPGMDDFGRLKFYVKGRLSRTYSLNLTTGQTYPYNNGCLDDVTSASRLYWLSLVPGLRK